MERLKELITQLKEQFDHKAEPAQLLEITLLLEAEIRLMASQPAAPARVMPTKIAVMMPSSTKIVAEQSTVSAAAVSPGSVSSAAATVQSSGPAVGQSSGPAVGQSNSPVVGQSNSPVVGQSNGPVVGQSNSPAAAVASTVSAPAAMAPVSGAQAAVAPTAVVNGNGTVTLKASPERGQWPFDPLAEKPTDRFTLSQKAREVNDVIGTANSSSLNDKLRSDVVDLKSTLNDSPVRDLRKAIGLNDRYLFINQLFRGDEVMYERSLKTINGFRILPEAEYWMERELKVKLGWDENRETTRHFYQLVKRRFS
jgi:hypothetical protein